MECEKEAAGGEKGDFVGGGKKMESSSCFQRPILLNIFDV
jgi:hypothetical protein